jgi:hypothetical protein
VVRTTLEVEDLDLGLCHQMSSPFSPRVSSLYTELGRAGVRADQHPGAGTRPGRKRSISAPSVRKNGYGIITKRLSPVTCLLKLIPRAFTFTPSLVPGGAWPPGSWIWQLTS